MKIVNKAFKTIEELRRYDLSNFSSQQTLIQIFSGFIQKDEVEEIVTILQKQDINFIGTTTAGEIASGKLIENSITLSITQFENTEVETAHVEEESDFQTGVQLAKQLIKDNTKAVILFSEGLKANGEDLVQGFSSVNRNVIIAGGMAGDNGLMKETFIFDNSGVYNSGVVGASLNSDILQVFTDYQLNWQPIGKVMTVTKANKNILYEINNMGIKEIYQKYLGDKIADLFPVSAIEFPLVKVEEDGTLLGRVLISSFQDEGFIVAGNFNEGDKVRFAFGNVDLIVNQTKENIIKLSSLKPEVLYIYSCVSRKWFLQQDVNIELAPLNDIAQNSGFFTYGEIFHKNNKNLFLNVTMTILGLSETECQSQDIIENHEVDINEAKRFLVLEALTNLSNEVIRELEESKQTIEEAHNLIQDSIKYASIIQKAILPKQSLNLFFKDYFILWKPRDIVGGDIYFIENLSDYEVLIMVIDCTGHGIPGAFVTMLIKAIEKQIIFDISNRKLTPSPSAILDYFNFQLSTLTLDETFKHLGFDGGILYYNKKEKYIKYSGAQTPLFYLEDGEVQMLKGARESVGYGNLGKRDYKEYILQVRSDMTIFITTDGFIDQNGGKKDLPFGKKRFKKLINNLSNKPLEKQKEEFLRHFHHWKKHNNQTDDLTVIGIKI